MLISRRSREDMEYESLRRRMSELDADLAVKALYWCE